MNAARDFLLSGRSSIRRGGSMIERLYDSEAPRLFRFFGRRIGDREAAPDLVQDAFVRLASTDRVAELDNPAAYLQRIARNVLIDHTRRKPSVGLLVPLEDWDAVVSPDQEDGLNAEDLLARYERAIAGLPERTRLVFLMSRADDLTYRQIAKRLDLTLWTVEYHMKRALIHLDRMLDER